MQRELPDDGVPIAQQWLPSCPINRPLYHRVINARIGVRTRRCRWILTPISNPIAKWRWPLKERVLDTKRSISCIHFKQL